MSRSTVLLAVLLVAFVASTAAQQQRRPRPNGRGYRRGPGEGSAAFKNRQGPGVNGRFFDPRKSGGSPFKPPRRKPFKPFVDRQFRLPSKSPQLEFDLIAPPPPSVPAQRFPPVAQPSSNAEPEDIISIEELNRPRRQPDTFEPVKKDRPLLEEIPVPQVYQPAPSSPIRDVAESRDSYFIPSGSSSIGGSSGPAYEDFNEIPPEQRDLERAIVGQADAYQVNNEKAEVYQKEDRLEFQIHGHQGPNSYRYGYDTGHGYNRQFRYEEKDKDGIVNGRYGYFDPYGKLHVVNYSSHPEHGYKASGDGVPTR